MKLLVLSDVHSNVECLKAIWSKEYDANAIYMAGDLVDYGTNPSDVIDWLCDHNALCVQGNHDETVIRNWYAGTFRDVPAYQLTWAQHNCLNMTQKHINYLEKLPTFLSLTADGIQYLMTHKYGKRYEVVESLYQFNLFWSSHHSLKRSTDQPRRMIFGHSHRQIVTCFGENTLCLNPGSASYRRPDDPSKDAFYMVIENGEIQFHQTPYDRGPLYSEVLRQRANLNPMEWEVADFFFGKEESDGPNMEWMNSMKKYINKEL